MHQQLQWPAAFALVLVLIAISAIILVAYRFYLSPLAQIPGPKIAAVSGLYEFYFDCLLGGKYFIEIERMHNVYGMLWLRCLCQSMKFMRSLFRANRSHFSA